MSEQRHLTWVAGLTTFLTSLALAPLFQEQPWLVRAALVIAAVSAAGLGGRALALPPVLVALGQVFVVTLLLTYQFGAPETRWWGLPTWDTFASLNDLGVAGRELINRFAPPVPPEPSVVMLTIVGIGVVAIAVDLLAVGLRLVPLAGLPLLALYTVPVAVVPDGVPWLFFVLAAASFVGLLVAEGRERLSRWGRSMGFSEREVTTHSFVGEVETGPIARLGRRIGAAAVCLAVAVPGIVPLLDEGLIGGGLGTGGSGGRIVQTNDPIVDLRRDLSRDEDVPVFRYSTRDSQPKYFRSATLDTFKANGDGGDLEWTRFPRNIPNDQLVAGDLPPVPGSEDVPGEPQTTTIDVSDNYDATYLPLPYLPTAVRVDGRWGYDAENLNVLGFENGTAGISYEVDSLALDYTAVDPTGSTPDDLDFYLELPDDIPAEVRIEADAVTSSAATPVDKAMALQAWFREEFEYSTEVVEVADSQDLVAFLQAREGYCEQFAATMAIMARLLDIPARVNVGFLAGAPLGPFEREVSSFDAHAWPELYIDGWGWTAFEPTPGSRTGLPPAYSTAAPIEPTETASAAPAPTSTASVAPNQRDDVGLGVTSSSGGFTFPVVPVLIGLGVLLLLTSPFLARLAMTRRRWSRAASPEDRVLAAWALLKDRAADLGYGWDRSDTPRTLARRLRAAASLEIPAAEALDRLARAAERVMFARDPGSVGDVRAELGVVSDALQASVPRGRRLRAQLLPPSTGRLVSASGERIADVLDAVEAAPSALRRVGRRPREAASTQR